MDRVGLIGLGLMGSALAERMLGAGLRVIGYDLREECLQHLAAQGGASATSVRAVFEAARTVVLSLPNSDVVRGVLGEAGDGVRGATIIDTTTGDPDAAAATGRLLSERGADYLDATLTGSSALARAGELIVTAGGSETGFLRAQPLFRLFAMQSFHLGPCGSGSRAKLVVNLVLGLNRAVLAEGLAFARQCGLQADTMLEILKSGAAYSRAMDTKGRKMLDADFAPEAKLSQHLKDVHLILETGARVGATLPLCSAHAELLATLVVRGLGELDNSAVIKAFESPQ